MRTLLILCLLVVLGVGGVSGYLYTHDRGPKETVRVTVTNASLFPLTGELLQAKVLDIFSVPAFLVGASATGAAQHFSPGIWTLEKKVSIRMLLRELTTRARQEVRVTIPEGSDIRDIAQILIRAGIIQKEEELFQVTGKPAVHATHPPLPLVTTSTVFATLPRDVSFEGYLFPDTYRFYADATAQDVVKKLLATFVAKTSDLWQQPHPQKLNTHQLLTLASLVEAEVRGKEDQRKVADLFLRRLARGMPFQADSTVHYVVGGSTGSVFTSGTDRDTQSPWNTYQEKGLPPGPIVNPGLGAIEAVLHPLPNDAWYFLTGKDGEVHYARTLDEHVANKRFLR